MDQFDIYFRGQILPDAQLDAVKAKFSALYKLEGAKLDALFSGNAVRLKTAVDVETASKYREKFRSFGALIDIVPVGQKPKPIAPKALKQAKNAHAKPLIKKKAAKPATLVLTDQDLLPANTGSLADTALPVEPIEIPDISQIELDFLGIDLDQTIPPKKLEIDTSELAALPPNSGSLEDCMPQKEPVKLPDIRHLKLLD